MKNMTQNSTVPRRLFTKQACGAIASAIGAVSVSAIAEKPDDYKSATSEHRNRSSQALERLIAGNQRFVDGKLRHPHLGDDWRSRLAAGQKPFATILGCSDSRVPPELLFDQGFGDLFVVRVAGNVIDTDVSGSIEYGVDHLATRLVVVMGHDGCGAVTAAMQTDSKLAEEPNEIRSLVGKIKPAIRSVSPDQPFAAQLRQSVEANVRASLARLSKVPDIALAVREERTRLVGCIYDIHSSVVRVLPS